MSTGDAPNILARLKAVLPQSWFPDTSPVLDGLLTGFATVGSFVYGLIAYARLQTRVQTATDGFLDLAAFDFFGLRVRRKQSQSDASLRALIQAEVLRERATRFGIQHAVEDLTGNPVRVFETFNPQDSGGWGTYAFAFDMAGYWGSSSYPYTMFLDVVQPNGAGIPNLAGLDSSYSGWGAGYFYLADLSLVTGAVTDQDIYDTVEATRAAGILTWVRIGQPPVVGGRLDIDFVLDFTLLA